MDDKEFKKIIERKNIKETQDYQKGFKDGLIFACETLTHCSGDLIRTYKEIYTLCMDNTQVKK